MNNQYKNTKWTIHSLTHSLIYSFRFYISSTDRVWEVVLTDGLGRPLEGRTVGPLQEGSSLDLACQANHGKYVLYLRYRKVERKEKIGHR